MKYVFRFAEQNEHVFVLTCIWTRTRLSINTTTICMGVTYGSIQKCPSVKLVLVTEYYNQRYYILEIDNSLTYHALNLFVMVAHSIYKETSTKR